MLVLSRSVGESVMIGDSIAVTVVEVRGGVVRLGFDAPESIAILRDEIFRANEERARQEGHRGKPLTEPRGRAFRGGLREQLKRRERGR